MEPMYYIGLDVHKRKMAAGRAAISKASKKRWAKVRAQAKKVGA